MSIKEELIAQGWSSKGRVKCERCGEEVEVLESSGGRKQYFQLSESDRPGNWHKFHCGLTFAMQAPAEG